MRILIDADLLLEMLLNRNAVTKETAKIWQLAKARKIEGFITSLCLDKVYFTCMELADAESADRIVSSIESVLVTCSLNKSRIQKARLSNLPDFESALEAVCVSEIDLDGVVTHCPSNFCGSKFTVFSVERLISTFYDSNIKDRSVKALEHLFNSNPSTLTTLSECRDDGTSRIEQDLENTQAQTTASKAVRVKDLSSTTAALINITHQASSNSSQDFQINFGRIVEALNGADLTYNIFRQAGEGDIAATIQVLNEALKRFGVKIRAVFADEVLQLLCEAETYDELNQAKLTEEIRKTLELVAPRNIRWVNINSRIVRDYEPHWDGKINQNLIDGDLLWAQEIKLRQPSFIKTILNPIKIALSPIRSDLKKTWGEKYHFRKGMSYSIVGIGLLVTGFILWNPIRFAKNDNASAPTELIKQDKLNQLVSDVQKEQSSLSRDATSTMEPIIEIKEETQLSDQSRKKWCITPEDLGQHISLQTLKKLPKDKMLTLEASALNVGQPLQGKGMAEAERKSIKVQIVNSYSQDCLFILKIKPSEQQASLTSISR